MEKSCNLTEGAITSNHIIREAISIQCDKIYDACRQKECCEDLRVWFCPEEQALVNEATSVKVKKAELIWVFEDIEPVTFNHGYYAVDLKYYFNVKVELHKGISPAVTCQGLAVFNKKVILFGSEGETKTYTSKFVPTGSIEHVWKKTDLPKIEVQTMDPVALGACFCKDKKHHHHKHMECEGEHEEHEGGHEHEHENINFPENVMALYGGNIDCGHHKKHVCVTLGLFSIIKIMRSVQVLMPSYGYMPIKECEGNREDEPCSLFSRIHFPSNEFFPPEKKKFPKYEAYPGSTKDERIMCR